MTPAEQEARRRYDHDFFVGGRGLVEDCVRSFVDGAEWSHAPVEGANVVQKIVNAWDCCGTCAGGVLAAHVRENDQRADEATSRAEIAEAENALLIERIGWEAELVDQAEAAERALVGLQGRVRALADEWWSKAGPESCAWSAYGPQKVSIDFAVTAIRALLPPADAEGER